MRSSATPIRRPPRRPHRARPDAARSTLGQLLAPDLSLTLRSMGPSESLRRPGNRRPRVPRSHGPPEGRVNAAKVDIWLTSRRPASAPDLRLTFGQPLAFNLSLNSWSMRPWESARRPSNWRQGFPRSHGPPEGRVDGAKVDIRLTTRRPAAAPDAARAAAPGPAARDGRGQAQPSAPPRTCHAKGRALTEVADAAAR